MVSRKGKGSSMDQFLDVILDDLESHPQCPHGPTLLFRQMKQGKERRFFACAACRDRKLCSFFHWADEEFSEGKKKVWELEKQKLVSQEDPNKLYKRFCKIHKKLSSGKKAGYCHSCQKLLLPTECELHAEHDLTDIVSVHQLLHPSEVLKPLETNSKEAQYLFSMNAVETIIRAAKTINVRHILCMGTPRVHENSKDLESLLLDLDRRYHSFYKPEDFCWFNSFNNHFFLGEPSMKILKDFIQHDGGEGFMLVMDPPFGGRIEPLAYTIKQIQKLHRKLNPDIQEDMRVMFISPYFMEHHIVASFPDFEMLDYKIAYDNHPLFSQGTKAGKLGSPVRIFTNIPPEYVPLPAEEGYWFCKPCKRWVSEENKHCNDCMKCTSKNGCTYVHCFKCQRCVKPSWKHCDKCQRCCLVPHKCGSFEPSGVCYKCGNFGHKKYDCPEGVVMDKKRKLKKQQNSKRKKKKNIME